jgi:metal-dependent hydrolase (beta-lactamase superfamily II)
LSIKEIDQISITIVMDNTTDFLLTDSGHATRPSFIQNGKLILPPPVAELGFSALITIFKSELGTSNSLLFDTGVSENGV